MKIYSLFEKKKIKWIVASRIRRRRKFHSDTIFLATRYFYQIFYAVRINYLLVKHDSKNCDKKIPIKRNTSILSFGRFSSSRHRTVFLFEKAITHLHVCEKDGVRRVRFLYFLQDSATLIACWEFNRGIQVHR